MDLLLLYHRLPYPPNKGEKTRAYQQLSYLSRRHRVWMACFIDDEGDYAHVDAVREMCHCFQGVPLNKRLALSRGGFNLLRGRTLTEGYFGHRGMWQPIREWTAERHFDVALAFSSSMGGYVEDLAVRRRVLDLVDFDSRKWSDYATKTTWPLSAMFRTEAERLARRELEMVSRFDLTFVVNPRERRLLDDPQLRERVVSFPTLVNRSDYRDMDDVPCEPIIGFVGTMDYRPNVEAVLWFAREVWPKVLKKRPDAQWWVVGRNPTVAVQALAARPGVTVTGGVDDVRPHLKRMRVFVAPLRIGIGIPTKVLEAMAAGRPVITTAHGHHGVGGVPDHDYLVADTAADFAAAILALLNDHPRCQSLGRAATALIQNHYDAETRMPHFEQHLLGPAREHEPRS